MALSAIELEEVYANLLARWGFPDTSNCFDEPLLRTLSEANRRENLLAFLELIDSGDILEERNASRSDRLGKIIVVGHSMIKVEKMMSIAKNEGFDTGRFEFKTEYFGTDLSKLRDRANYCSILVGPIPHSMKGIEGSSSMIAQTESNQDRYPLLIRMTSGSDLKITNNSFRNALRKLIDLGLR